jgi:autoinducer 2-degrading protein
MLKYFILYKNTTIHVFMRHSLEKAYFCPFKACEKPKYKEVLVRIVKMTFAEGRVDEFLARFAERRARIAAFPGCERLELLRDTQQKGVFFTLSHWQTEDDLESYRQSELFRSTWAMVKPMFAQKAEAWTVEKVG